MRRGFPRSLILVAAVAAAAGAWVAGGHQTLSVPRADLVRFERSVFSPAGQDGVPERLFVPFNYDLALGPEHLHLVMTEDHRAKPTAEDITIDEVRIPKRFRFDR